MSELILSIDTEVLVKLLLSILVGICIGRERKKHEKSGGMRTVALVCLGATVMGILNIELMKLTGLSEISRINIARIPAYTLVAIGFLGRGIITKVGKQIEGLTTASTLFCIVPVGVCLGMGFYNIAILTSILIFIILEMKYVRRK